MNNKHDPQDYDGMGNHGRFPPDKEPQTTSATTDLLMIVGACMIIGIWVAIR